MAVPLICQGKSLISLDVLWEGGGALFEVL